MQSNSLKSLVVTKAERARAFALHYMENQSERAAAMHVGVQPESALRVGRRMLRTKIVIGALKSIGALTKSEKVKDVKALQEFFSRVIDGNIAELPDELFINPITGVRYSKLECDGIRWRNMADMKERVKCAELLGKTHGAFIEKIEKETHKETQVIERIIERRIVHVGSDINGNVIYPT